MQTLKLLSFLTIFGLFFSACNLYQPEKVVENVPISNSQRDALTESVDDYWAKENLNLVTISDLLQKANNAREFERLLNEENGVNNLDLNGDGYVDYISVREYDERPDNRRGLSLFTRFDGDDIQEIATILFDRDPYDRRGARILLTGNEQIYGNNYFYEGNWLDKTLDIASWIFSDRDDYYRSPYYYNYYPDNYRVYRVVDYPVYRSRITKYMVNPAMTKITTPTMKIKIKSPYAGRSYRRVYARMVNPTEDQKIFIKNNPKRPKFVAKGKDRPDFDKKGGPPARNLSDSNPGRGKEKADHPGKKVKENPSAGKGNGKAEKIKESPATPYEPRKVNMPKQKNSSSPPKTNGKGGNNKSKGKGKGKGGHKGGGKP